MAAQPWQLGPLDYQNLTNFYPIYFPSDQGGGGVMTREEAQEALQWCMAFAYVAFNPTVAPEISEALQNRRARFFLEKLRSLRGGSNSPGIDVTKRLMCQPDKCLAEIGLGFDLACALLGRQTAQLDEKSAVRPVDVELVAPELDQPVQAVRSELIDRYVGLRGSVVRAANIAPLITELSFTCGRCSTEVATTAIEGRFEYPPSCPKKCRFARFSVNRDQCKAIDWQRIRLQEDFAELAAASGPQRRMPRTVDCDLKRGLVGSCVPGDVVTLYGIVRCMPTSGGMSGGGDGRQAPTKSLYILFLEVKAVVNNRRADSLQAGVATQNEDEFSPLQLSFIREIYKEPAPGPPSGSKMFTVMIPEIFWNSPSHTYCHPPTFINLKGTVLLWRVDSWSPY